MRLQLLPGLVQLRRDERTLQLGLSTRVAVVLSGLTETDHRFLDRLVTGLPQTQVRPGRQRELVELLDSAQLLLTRPASAPVSPPPGPAGDDATVWGLVHPGPGAGRALLAARARARVCLLTTRPPGRTAQALLTDLREAGCRPRLLSVRAPGAGPSPADLAQEDLVLAVGHGALDPAWCASAQRAGVAFLPVVLRETDALLGPSSTPGQGPCATCVDLHRADRDRAWPRMVHQLLSSPPVLPVPEETLLAKLVSAVAVLQAFAVLDGRQPPATAGATLEIELPDGLTGRRPWPPHPRCRCTSPVGAVPGFASPTSTREGTLVT